MTIPQVSKCQSLSTTILSRTTLTWTIILHLPCVLMVFIATVPEQFLSVINDRTRICQLSWIIRECPGYGTDLPLFCMGHQISPIKWTFELFCALVWNLTHFFLKIWTFLFIIWFLEHSCTYLVSDRGQFVGGEWWGYWHSGEGGKCKIERLQVEDLLRLTSLHAL